MHVTGSFYVKKVIYLQNYFIPAIKNAWPLKKVMLAAIDLTSFLKIAF